MTADAACEVESARVIHLDEYQYEDVAQHIFNAVRQGAKDTITRRDLETALDINGISTRDRRIRQTMDRLKSFADMEPIDSGQFAQLLDPSNTTLIERALKGDLVIPDFGRFRRKLVDIFESLRSDTSGDVADYIPQLARVDPDMYAMAVCTVDGQVFSVGNDDETFCVQSTTKPINYAVALELVGAQRVHQHVGREPSGLSFNELTLNAKGLPHNPMINAGAIMCASLIKPELSLAGRFDYVMSVWNEAAGGTKCAFDNSVYHSEKATADRNFALAHFMREKRAFPENADMFEALDFYFQCCSILVTAPQMASIAATFAAGGICPLTDRRIFSSETVKHCLSLMYSCGMYDFSGEYAFTVGLPAKSGVSGALMIVVPGVCGITIWSPRLDELGNSVRGVEFSKRLIDTFAFHTYAGMDEARDLIDPRKSEAEVQADKTVQLCWAASRGDINEIKRLIGHGIDLNQADYDGRTALHLAASEGQATVVRYLLDKGAMADPVDRWGHTPLDDARTHDHQRVADLLTERI